MMFRLRKPTLALALLGAACLSPVLRGGESPAPFQTPVLELRPMPERAMVEFQSGPLWLVADTTKADFLLMSNVFSYEPHPHFVIPVGPGKFSLGPLWRLLTDYYIEGPETYYLGVSGGFVMEYWLPGDTTLMYFRPSGGFGITDSAGEEGDGQAQDFTLNYSFETGVRHQITEKLSVSLALYFQHFSDGGVTDYNIGYNALGPVIGISYSF